MSLQPSSYPPLPVPGSEPVPPSQQTPELRALLEIAGELRPRPSVALPRALLLPLGEKWEHTFGLGGGVQLDVGGNAAGIRFLFRWRDGLTTASAEVRVPYEGGAS